MSRALAERLFGHQDALGRHIRFGTEPETRDLEIIGIVANARIEDARAQDPNVLYLNLWQLPRMANYGNLELRYTGAASAVVREVRAALRNAGRQFDFRVHTIREQQDISLLPDRLMAAIGTVYGVLALTLAAVGLFGLLSFFVASRKSEIGLRMALGAGRTQISSLVLRETLVLVGAGVIAGLPVSYAAIRVLANLIYGTHALPVWPIVLSIVAVSVVAVLASLVPVYRAGSVNPASVLNHD